MKKLLGVILTAAGSIATFEFLRKKGVVDEVSGKIKQNVGALTKDRKMQAEGLFEEGKGHVKGFVDDVKHAVDDLEE